MGLLQICDIREEAAPRNLLMIDNIEHVGYNMSTDDADGYKETLIAELAHIRNRMFRVSKRRTIANLNFVFGALTLLNMQGVVDDDEFNRIEKIVRSIEKQVSNAVMADKLAIIKLATK